YPSSRHLPPLVKAFIELAVQRLNAISGNSDDYVIVSR
ncbi:LysR family transcriptional regulator, partial [Rhizobium ruizarguesonis]